MGKKEQAPARAIFVQGSLWVWSATSRGRPPDGGLALALERDTMGNPRFLVTRSPNGRGLAPIGTSQHQICLVRPFLSRKAISFGSCGSGGNGPLKHSFSKPQTQTGSRGDPTVFSFGVTMTGEEPVDRSSRHGSDGCLHCSGASGPGLLGPGDRAAAGRAGRRRRGGGRRVAGGRGGTASRPGL